MIRKELVDRIAQKTGRSHQQADQILVKMLETIKETVAAGEVVRLVGFGTFELHKFAARKYSMPKKKNISVDARNLPVFRAGRVFKDEVN